MDVTKFDSPVKTIILEAYDKETRYRRSGGACLLANTYYIIACAMRAEDAKDNMILSIPFFTIDLAVLEFIIEFARIYGGQVQLLCNNEAFATSESFSKICKATSTYIGSIPSILAKLPRIVAVRNLFNATILTL